MPELLKEKVAVITGAGRGLGRTHALAMAKQGARIVVNDFGVAADGSQSSSLPADQVVDEIKKAGGVAVANYDSVSTSEGASRIIDTATDNFGRLDILVNNAGVLRDRMVFNMSDEEWDMVIKTHLYGTFYCTRNASRIMREQKNGRIINTSSAAGLGNIGQANYSAAKEGIVGLTRSIAKDLARYNITCNAVRPRAVTRMTLTDQLYESQKKKLGDEMAEVWKRELLIRQSEDVSPFYVYLASEKASHISACVFEVYQNYIAIYADPPRLWRTIIKEGDRWSVEELIEVLPKTLTSNVGEVSSAVNLMLAPDAQGWAFSDGVLRETEPSEGMVA